MRRIVISILLFTSIFNYCFATEVLESSSAKVNILLTESEEMIVLGFSYEPVISRSINLPEKIDNLPLLVEEKENGHILSETVHAFWHVISPNDLKVKVTATPLSDDYGNTLDFIAYWIPSGEEEFVFLGEDGNLEAEEVYVHSPDDGIMNTGSVEVKIETEELIGNIPGVYHGEFILMVEGE